MELLSSMEPTDPTEDGLPRITPGVFFGAPVALAERAAVPIDLPELIRMMLDAYFSTLERDLVATRAFLVEFDALGPKARERRRAGLRPIAEYVRQMHRQFRASDPTLAPVFAD